MNLFPLNIKPFGESAILIEWPKAVNETILQDILSFKEALKQLLPADWAMVPTYNSLTLIKNDAKFNFKKLRDQIQQWYKEERKEITLTQTLWELPVCYAPEFGVDLAATATKLNLTTETLIKQHTSHQFTVYGIGFLPGFMYLGGLPKSLETERRQSPRLHVHQGSVGLAGKQTGIYPQDSPGGWNIIGRCPVPLFNLKLQDPCFVNVGDQIKFKAIDRATFDLHTIEVEVGIYTPKKRLLNA